MSRPSSAPRQAKELAQFLGWFSIGLGAVELFAGRSVSRWLGMEDSEGLLRTYGMREIATGTAILASEEPTPWIWARVGGDALDLATLGAIIERNPAKSNVLLALAAVGGVTALDLLCAQWLRRRPQEEHPQIYADRSGFPRGLAVARGAAAGFVPPADFRTPELMRPFDTA